MPRKTFRKIITTPEKLKEINPKNQKLVTSFLNNLKKNHSEKTIKVYKSNFEIFFVWNLENNDNKFFIDLKKRELNDFFGFCVEELQWNSARYSNMHSSLSSLSNYIENMLDDDYPEFRNIVKKIEKLPNEKVREKTVFREEVIDAFLKKLKEEKRYQEACYLALVISCGARFSELLRFTTDLIDEKNTIFDGLFLETKSAIKTKGRGKNGKMLKKYIIKDIFLPYYKLWLPERTKIMEEHEVEPHNSIFIKKNGEPAQESTVRSWIKKWEKELNENVYVHSFRHYACTYLCDLIDESLVKELFGWESADMVGIYNDASVFDRKWDLDKIKKKLGN